LQFLKDAAPDGVTAVSRSFKSSLLITVIMMAVIAWPAQADAQRRGHRGRGGVVVVGGGFGYPGFWLYDQWWGPWGPYGRPWGPYGRPYPYYFDEFNASLKFDVKPKDAEVYVDGALAGQIDDFDGIFQSLKLRPGGHEIVVYRDGFRSVREELYLESFATRRLRFNLEPLAPGESQEPRPQPRPETEPPDRPRARPMPPRIPDPRVPRPAPREPQRTQFGTLSLRIVPADAEVYVDGERWAGPAGAERLTIELVAGRHRVEVRKAGLSSYSEEVLIRAGATLTLNVALK
jgi:hypothetical protein